MDKDHAKPNKIKTLVVGIFGGIDPSCLYFMCYDKTSKFAVSMPTAQLSEQHDLSMEHGSWLEQKFINVEHEVIDLDKVYDTFWLKLFENYGSEHAFANTKSKIKNGYTKTISVLKEVLL